MLPPDSNRLREIARSKSPHHGWIEELYDRSGLNRWFLRAGSPAWGEPDSSMLVSPADCRVDAICPIEAGGSVPGKSVLGGARSYRVPDLVGPGFDEELQGGWCAVLYLAPWYLHWMVAPMHGRIVERRYRAGNCLPIIFMKRGEVENERLGIVVENEKSRLHVVFVGSFMVSGIVCPHEVGDELEQRELLGAFKLGSTVLLLSPPGAFEPLVHEGQRLKAGQPMGRSCAELKTSHSASRHSITY